MQGCSSAGIGNSELVPLLRANFASAVEILGEGLVAANSPLVRKMRAQPGPTSLQPLLRLAYGLVFLLVDGKAPQCRLTAILADLLARGAFRDNFEDMPDEICSLGESGALAAALDALLAAKPAWGGLTGAALGSLHESLLETRPVFAGQAFKLQSVALGARKTSGSYYTPGQLVDCLLDSALEPLIARCLEAKNPQQALLGLKICDPACGCGNFLIAAAKRLALRLAQLRGEACGGAHLREIMTSCIYGVDINPLSVLVCKFCLWLECREGPLADYNIACGNFLLGVNLKSKLPEIFRAAGCERGGGEHFDGGEPAGSRAPGPFVRQGLISLYDFENRARIFPDVDSRMKFCLLTAKNANQAGMEAFRAEFAHPDSCPQAGIKKPNDPDRLRLLYDLWTMAEMEDPAKNGGIGRQIVEDYAQTGRLEPEIARRVASFARNFRFFHLEVMFPDVAGGFDAVLSNPPWENNEIRDKEWFAARGRPDIARLAGAARKQAIAALAADDPGLFAQYGRARSEAAAMRRFYAANYPLCGKGKINLYAIFVEAMRNALNTGGILGCIVPSGLATDENTRFLFQDLVDNGNIANLHDFENRNIFPDVHSSYKFCLLTASEAKRREAARYAFFLHSTTELEEPGRCVRLSPEDIALLNPNTRTCPVFRNAKDAELARAVYRRLPVLVRLDEKGKVAANPWKISFSQGMFNMTTASGLFRTGRELSAGGWELDGNAFVKNGKRFLPLYEAKMIHHFNHRFAGCLSGEAPRFHEYGPDDLENPHHAALPRYWLAEENVKKANGGWLMGFRNVCRPTDERTLVGGAFPFAAVGNSLPIWSSGVPEAAYFPAMLSSFACDFFARLKIGGMNFNFYLARQLAVLPPDIFRRSAPWDKKQSLGEWLWPRVLELTFTSWDMRPWAVALGYHGKPFAWGAERRFLLRAELDAAFFHLYLPASADGSWLRCENEKEDQYRALSMAFPCPRDAVDYIMETFTIRKRKDEQKFGAYRTKAQILEIYDVMLQDLDMNPDR